MPGQPVGVIRRGWRAVALAVVVALGVGAGLALAFAPAPEPSWARPPASLDAELAVSAREFSGDRSIPVTAKLSVERQLTLPTGGILRESGCQVGKEVSSGTAPFLVDDRRVLALHTGTPLWRDLGTGSRGDDVEAVQLELNRLGYGVEATGYYGGDTASAVRDLWADIGGDERQTKLPLGQVMWLPRQDVVASQCPLHVGQTVAAGEVGLITGGGLRSLTLRLESQETDDDLVAVVDDVSAPVPRNGVLTDPDFLRAYAGTRHFVEFTADPSTQLTVSVRLAEASRVVAIPPSALYEQNGADACVLSDGKPVKVTVVASELGQTLVAADPPPERVQVDPGEDPPPCR